MGVTLGTTGIGVVPGPALEHTRSCTMDWSGAYWGCTGSVSLVLYRELIARAVQGHNRSGTEGHAKGFTINHSGSYYPL